MLQEVSGRGVPGDLRGVSEVAVIFGKFPGGLRSVSSRGVSGFPEDLRGVKESPWGCQGEPEVS